MLKNIIAPLQNWLLENKRCVGCGTLLKRGQKSKNKSGKTTLSCKCNRVFIYNPDTKQYRRALQDEVD